MSEEMVSMFLGTMEDYSNTISENFLSNFNTLLGGGRGDVPGSASLRLMSPPGSEKQEGRRGVVSAGLTKALPGVGKQEGVSRENADLDRLSSGFRITDSESDDYFSLFKDLAYNFLSLGEQDIKHLQEALRIVDRDIHRLFSENIIPGDDIRNTIYTILSIIYGRVTGWDGVDHTHDDEGNAIPNDHNNL